MNIHRVRSKSESRPVFDPRDTGLEQKDRSRLLGQISFYGVALVILVSAVPYGTVEGWHRSLLVFAIAVFGVFRLLDGLTLRVFNVAEPTLLAPLLGVLGLATIQIVPSIPDFASISVAPQETKSFILLFGGLLVCGEILFTYTDSVYRLKALIALVLVVAAASAVFGFLREWVIGSESGVLSGYFNSDQGYAQFINRNHFAFLMEMGLGLILGLLLRCSFSEWYRFWGWLIAGTFIYSLMAANSRGGLISFAMIAIVAVFFHVTTSKEGSTHGPTPKSRAWVVRRVAAGLLACVLAFGVVVVLVAFVGGDPVATRFERVSGEIETLNNSRVNRNRIWSSTLELIEKRPLLGSGFGGYGVAISEFDASAGIYSLKQAHNDYLEILANGGVVSFLLFAAFALMVAVRIRETVRLSNTFRGACGFGAGLGIFGVLVHSLVDFGLHVSVNSLILVVLIVVGSVRHVSDNGIAFRLSGRSLPV